MECRTLWDGVSVALILRFYSDRVETKRCNGESQGAESGLTLIAERDFMKFLQPDPLWRYGRHPCGTVILSTIDRRVAVLDERCIWHRAWLLTWEAHARRSKGCALTPREHARHCVRGIRAIVEERRRPAEPKHPPAEYLRCAAGEDSQRRRRGRGRRGRAPRRAVGDAAERRAEHLVPGTTVGPVHHERMNHGDDREARAGGGVANRGPATIGVPAEDALVGEAQAPNGVRTHGEFHAPGRHLEDVCSA